MLNSHWKQELKKPVLGKQSLHRAALRGHEPAGTGMVAVFQNSLSTQCCGQGPCARGEPQPSRRHLRLHLLLPPPRAPLETPSTQPASAQRVQRDGGSCCGEAEPLLSHQGMRRGGGVAGGAFHLAWCFRRCQKLEMLDIIFKRG